MKFLAMLLMIFCSQSHASLSVPEIEAFLATHACRLKANDFKSGAEIYSRDLNQEIEDGKRESFFSFSTKTYLKEGRLATGGKFGFISIARSVEDVRYSPELTVAIDPEGSSIRISIGIGFFSPVDGIYHFEVPATDVPWDLKMNYRNSRILSFQCQERLSK